MARPANIGSGTVETRTAAGWGPAMDASGRLACTAARRFCSEVGAPRINRLGTTRLAPSTAPPDPPVARRSGPPDNCALRDPSGSGTAVTLGLSPTIAILMAEVEPG